MTKIIETTAIGRGLPGPALVHTYLGYENGMNHQTIIPLQYLLKGWGDATNGYQCYTHTISINYSKPNTFQELLKYNLSDENNYYYVGITGRNWLLRLEEHIYEMRIGSHRSFYQFWRKMFGSNNVLFTSFLNNINLSFEDAMNWEEINVDKIASDKYGLNMIPGGFKGLKYLHSLGLIGRLNVSLDKRDEAISAYIKLNPRKGMPNPFISDLWKDDEFYLKVIEARKKTLSVSQVKKIRELHMKGVTAYIIFKEVDALNITQVRNVIIGKTYNRVK